MKIGVYSILIAGVYYENTDEKLAEHGFLTEIVEHHGAERAAKDIFEITYKKYGS